MSICKKMRNMIEYMNNMLSQNVFDELEQKKYVGMMEEAGEVLYQKAKEKLTAVYIECICLRLLQSEEYDRMQVWCERSRELHPDVLSTYTLQLKLYFTIQDKQKFFEVLNSLKQSDIVIDRDTLALIRAFYEFDGEKTKKTVMSVLNDNVAENTVSEQEDTKTKNEKESEEQKTENREHENSVNENKENKDSEEKESKNLKHENPESNDIKKSDIETERLETLKDTAIAALTTAISVAAEVEESVKEDTKSVNVEIPHTVETVKDEESQSIVEAKKSEESKVLQKIFEEIEQEEAVQRMSEEAALTKFMVSNVIDDLMSEHAVTEDINVQINHIIEELIAESEAREQQEAVLYQTRQIQESRISDKKKIDVLKTIARKHKIWTWLGLGLVIASACLIIYMKNKKCKEE